MEVKQALTDGRFRDTLPLEIRDEVAKYLHCPSCASNINFFRKIHKTCRKQLAAYYPDKEFIEEEQQIETLAANHWSVFSCHINDLEGKLRTLPKGRKQIAMARWEDQVTVVVNEIDYIY